MTTDLKTPKIRSADIYGFMKKQLLLKLTELCLKDCFLCNSSDVSYYFSSIRSLKAFHFKVGPRRIYSVFFPGCSLLHAVLKYTPNLEVLSFESSRADSCDYNEILKLDNLRQLKIVSYSPDCIDIYDFLRELALKNTVEKLVFVIKICSDRHESHDWNDEFPSFSSLRSFKIENLVEPTKPFLTHFVKNITNLRKCTMRSWNGISQQMNVDVNVLVRYFLITQMVIVNGYSIKFTTE